MNIGAGIRAAIVAGVTAGITVSLMLMSGHGSVTVHNTAADAADVDSTTTTTVAAETTTTEAPTTTTTAAATTTTTLSVEQRLQRLEQSTTTTTVAKSVAPSVAADSHATVVDGVATIKVMFINHQDTRSRQMFPNPAVRLLFSAADGTTAEVTAPLPAQETGTITVTFPAVDPTAVPTGTVRIVDTEWDGGSLPTGAGLLEK